ncbi:hypothetical protein LX32DRAFT_657952 [Colletotrichum zoysiae]|uniref:Secreted protein n=1 Tax=Colletotrichum zoysiae TaxID=1216348 RepID=A0AAD9H429_9PEZI|nr:hypothetical protein LX32DRAFT_657952 [Colletotrichum zoysiae]
MRLMHILTFAAMVVATLMTGVQCDTAKKDPGGPSCLSPNAIRRGITQKCFEPHTKTRELEQAIQQKINDSIHHLKVLSAEVKSLLSVLDQAKPTHCPYKPSPNDLNDDRNDNRNDNRDDHPNGGTNPVLVEILERIVEAQEKQRESIRFKQMIQNHLVLLNLVVAFRGILNFLQRP